MLKILTGRAGSGKTTTIINEIINRLNDDKDKKNLILFVPEQMSFQAEYEIAKRVKGESFSRLQVFSFKRLAYRVFMEVGGLNKTFINDIVVEMMITKIIVENKERFLLYNKLSANFSFVQLVHNVLKEFKSYDITKELIDSLLVNEFMDETLKKKLHDLSIIYTELNKLYGNKLIDNEDFYHELTEKINNSNYIKNADIYIDGYHSFTTVELNTIYEMLKTCKSMTVLFTLDDPELVDMSKEDNLFNLPYRTFVKIKNFALENNINVKIDHLPNNQLRRFNNKALAFLEKNYDTDESYNDFPESIEIIETENPTSEVHAVARIIYNDIFKNQTSYSDYVIFINNQDVYYPLIHNIFSLYDIPVFIDDKKSMLDHSLLNFIDAALESIKTNFSYDAVFRAIKTEIFIPIVYKDEVLTEKNYKRMIKDHRKHIDLLENYCLSHGINGKDWEKDFWDIDIYKKLSEKSREKTSKEKNLEKIINETKSLISNVMLKFKREFTEASCVKEQVEAIYTLLLDLEIEKKLDVYEKVKLNNNEVDLNEAKKHKQVYNQLMDLFDELVEVCKDYQVNTDEFIKILRTGFKSLKFAIVPPAIDQVMVGTLKRSRFEMMGHFDDPKSIGVKKAFVLGVNENEIPKIQNESGLITSKEREFLISQDIELMPTVETSFLEEFFIIYTVLCSASDALILSYTLSNHEKKETYRSEIITKILNLFPQLKVETIYDFPSEEKSQVDYITTKNMTSKMVLQAINLLRKGYEVHEIWRGLYGYYKHNKILRNKLLGVSYSNEPDNLEKDNVKLLYGDTITASISSVEKFNHCPYSYFLDKGLELKTRDIKTIEPMDIGDLYHETMKEIAYELIKDNKALHEYSLEEINLFVNRIVDEFSIKMQRKYFLHNQRNQYLLYKIKQSLFKSLQTMHYQSKHSEFKIVAVEEKFGYDAKKLKVTQQILPTGFEMRLKGYIDRIDVSEKDSNAYVRIIDYKSGNKDIDFTKIYHRLSLQLFTYLDVVLENAPTLFNKNAYPAGVLYYHIQNPEITADKEMNENDILLKHHEQFKMNGYTLSDKLVSPLFDNKLLNDKKSDIVKVTFTNNGYHKTQSKVLDLNEINALRKYSKNAIVQSMNEMTSGKIDIKPVMYQKLSQCKYCDYHSVCKFDVKLRENNYNEINKIGDNAEIIEKIVKEYGSDVDE